MIDTSLIELEEAVQSGQILSAGMKVKLPIGEEAEIYGFIVIEDDLLSLAIDMPPLGECQVFSNRAIFYMDKQLYRFPIFKSVCKAREQKYGLHLLYVPKFINLPSKWDKDSYFESMSKEMPNPRVGKLEGIQIEENVAYYYSTGTDLYFESKSKLRAIGSGFVVITRRFSKPSENIKYEIFDSQSVMMERK